MSKIYHPVKTSKLGSFSISFSFPRRIYAYKSFSETKNPPESQSGFFRTITKDYSFRLSGDLRLIFISFVSSSIINILKTKSTKISTFGTFRRYKLRLLPQCISTYILVDKPRLCLELCSNLKILKFCDVKKIREGFT